MAASGEASTTPQIELAAQAYVYGYPLVYGLSEMAALVAGGGHLPVRTSYNEFGHVRELAGPDVAFVSPNNDTCYSIAVCDVRSGPLVLHVPDTADRYYVLQLVDAWSNNFAYVGRRATGTSEAELLLVAPDFDGRAPEGMRVVRAPTGVFAIVGRIQVDGEDDLPAVHALQDGLALEPLGAGAPTVGVPGPDPRVGAELEWWERFRVALGAFPPPAADAPYLRVCEQLGLGENDTPFADLDEGRTAVLVEGAKAGQAKIEELMRQLRTTPEGWQSALHAFDYNLDYLGLGTLDTPGWKIADRTQAYVTRAVAARAGLWGNHGYEADYAAIWVDSDGNALDGANRYELRLEQPPPVDAFWSLTMYDGSNFYLVANPIGRYSIGDRTPGLAVGDDGSITIYLQAGSPGPERESNWLPTPSGAFRPLLRMYQPRAEVLDGTYVLPAIRKA